MGKSPPKNTLWGSSAAACGFQKGEHRCIALANVTIISCTGQRSSNDFSFSKTTAGFQPVIMRYAALALHHSATRHMPVKARVRVYRHKTTCPHLEFESPRQQRAWMCVRMSTPGHLQLQNRPWATQVAPQAGGRLIIGGSPRQLSDHPFDLRSSALCRSSIPTCAAEHTAA